MCSPAILIACTSALVQLENAALENAAAQNKAPGPVRHQLNLCAAASATPSLAWKKRRNIFRANEHFAIANEVLADATTSSSLLERSLSSIFRHLLEQCSALSRADVEKMHGKVTQAFSTACLEFLGLCNFDYDRSLSCHCSGAREEQVLVGDGITLGWQLHRASIAKPYEPRVHAAPGEEVAYKQRLGVRRTVLPDSRSHKELRDLLSDPASGDVSTFVDRLRERQQGSQDLDTQAAAAFIEVSASECGEGGNRLPTRRHSLGVADCLQLLASGTAALQVAPLCVCSLLELLADRGAVSEMEARELSCLSRHAPHLLKVMSLPQSNDHRAAAAGLLRAFARRARSVAEDEPATTSTRADQLGLDKRSQIGNRNIATTTCLPPWHTREEAFFRTATFVGGQGHWQASALGGSDVLRKKGAYAADESRSSSSDPMAAASCNKLHEKRKSLLPGVFIIYCEGCQRALGFQAMPHAESPESPFELLLTRWQTPPDVFVCDNACKVSEYALNREPQHFANMQLKIDSHHASNHRHCAKSYTASAFNGRFKNTSLAEQFNARLSKCKRSVAYMTQPSALFYIRHLLFLINEKASESSLTAASALLEGDEEAFDALLSAEFEGDDVEAFLEEELDGA